jgi:hypothetical protein
MTRSVALVITDVSEECSASSIRVTIIGKLETSLAVTSNRQKLYISSQLSSSEMSVLTRTARRNIPEDTILHSHRREDFKSSVIDV